MRLFMLLTAFAILLGGCASGQPAVPAATSASTPVPAPTPTLEPTPAPTEMPADGGTPSPCDPSLIHVSDDRQKGFLKWSPDGSSLIFDFDQAWGYEQAIWQVGSDGSYVGRIANPKPNSGSLAPFGFHADLPPDGDRLVYSTCEYLKDAESSPKTEWPLRIYELAVISMDGGEPERLTKGADADHYPAWHPDGTRIAHVGTDSPHDTHYYFRDASVWVTAVDYDGRGPRTRRIPHIPGPAPRAPVWSPGGGHIAVVANPAGGAWSVYVADVSESSTSASAVVVGETSISPAWSPDGTRLAFAKNHERDGTETSTVRIVNRDGTGAVELPETSGPVSHVAWHPDGSEILVAEAGVGGLWTVSPDGQTFRNLFRPDEDRRHWGWAHGLAWSPDGSRFAIRTDSRGVATSIFLLTTAAREGNGWQILAFADGDSEQGFHVCNIPAQGPEHPSYEEIEKHCEPAGEQSP